MNKNNWTNFHCRWAQLTPPLRPKSFKLDFAHFEQEIPTTPGGKFEEFLSKVSPAGAAPAGVIPPIQ